jgi:Bacteriophage head to tail connecting protein
MRLEKDRPLPTMEEIRKVETCFNVFNQCEIYRPNFAWQWEEVSQLVMPNMRNTFFRNSYNFPGLKKTDRQIDATGMVMLAKFAAICDSMLTPFSSNWHELQASDPNLQKQRRVRLWMEEVSNALYRTRYLGQANFRKNNQMIWQQVGAFGNGPMFVDQLYDMHGNPVRGIRYKALPIGEVYIRTNHQGQVDAFVRAYRQTARQMMQKFGHDMLSPNADGAQDKNSEQLFDMFHCVYPNPTYDPRSKLSMDGKPFISHYIDASSKRLMQEGGYYSFPMPMARYSEWPNEVYGRGPAMDYLPSLKTLNAEKATFLKAGHRAGDPIIMASDDGIGDFDLIPGAMNKGWVNSDGQPLVHTLPAGDIQITDKMMDEERGILGAGFLTTIFETLVQNPNMTATQVIELINQKGLFLAPTVGGLSDYLEATIEREIDLHVQLRMIPPMPPELMEARGEYRVQFISPLFKMMRAGEASGFLRTMESALQVAGQMSDPSVLDWANHDVAWPAVAQIQSVPESWMASSDQIAAKRKARAQAQQQQQQVQQLPAQAAMLKARAVVAKQGGAQIQGQQPGGQQ